MKQAQINIQAQKTRLLIDVLGRALSSGECLANKAAKKSISQNFKYYDHFNSELNKNYDELILEFIDEIECFYKQLKRYINTYGANDYLESINKEEIKNYIMKWKNSNIKEADKILFEGLLDFINLKENNRYWERAKTLENIAFIKERGKNNKMDPNFLSRIGPGIAGYSYHSMEQAQNQYEKNGKNTQGLFMNKRPEDDIYMENLRNNLEPNFYDYK